MTLQQQAQFFAANDYCTRRAIVEAVHTEALAMNAALDVEYASIDQYVQTEEAKPRFKAVAAYFIVGAPRNF